MKRLAFDLETNGLLDKLDRIHCVTLGDLDTGKLHTFRSDDASRPIYKALELIQAADEVSGHNILGFDIPAIQKVLGDPDWHPQGRVIDTLVWARLVFADQKDLKQRDFRVRAKHQKLSKETMPGQLIGRQSLEAWGWRLGLHKGDYSKEMKAKGLDPWAEVNDDMVDYCDQDVRVTLELYRRLSKYEWSLPCLGMEMHAHAILLKQEAHGVRFDSNGAEKLYVRLLKEKDELEGRLKGHFKCWYRKGKRFTPKRDNKTRGYIAGVPFTKIELTHFKPASRDHIADRLQKIYNWKPKEWTEKGKPKVDEDTLSGLKYPIIEDLVQYLTVDKRIGMLANGPQSWMKADRGGRIHGRVNANGTATGRATHSHPNLGQVPSARGYVGAECRALFVPEKVQVLVGADASGLELRCLAHYIARFDGGDYGREVLDGDIHSVNQEAAGLPTRDNAKTFIYGFLYGAGDAKIGEIVGKGRKTGAMLRKRFLERLPALNKLLTAVKKKASSGTLRGLDGRLIVIRSEHSALNFLLQSAGAIIMKQAMCNLHSMIAEKGWVWGKDYAQVLWVHDEFQFTCRPELAEELGQIMVESMRMVTGQFNLRCPIDAEYQIGSSWLDTH